MTGKNTAMARVAPSAPMRYLAAAGLIKGRALDFGCGKGYDAREYNMSSYDSHYCPEMPNSWFDTITCSYVLNVIKDNTERLRVLTDIQDRLKDGGKAFITVRNDRRALCGKTSRGYQCHVILRLPVVRSVSGYVTYVLDCNDRIDGTIMETRTYDS